MEKSGTAKGPHQEKARGDRQRLLPLVELLIDTRAELMELAVASGMKVLEAMLEEDRTALCGPRYERLAERHAHRSGWAPSEVVLGGRKVAMRRPRVRAGAREIPLPTFRTFASTDPLDRRVVEQMLVGVATRQYARTLEPVGATVRTRGTSKSAVSRRFVARTAAQLASWQAAPLDGLDLVALMIDGVSIADHCVVVALGIDATGRKHALGLWEGSTENATVCQQLLSNLRDRGLRTDRSLLVVLDGSKALRKAVLQTFDKAAWLQRCQLHKMRNVLEHLPEGQRPWVQEQLRRAYRREDATKARRILHDLARRLEDRHPSAAESVREGLDETLTVLTLGLSERLRRTLATTNPVENLVGRIRHVDRNVKRWRSGTMVLRWVSAGLVEATKGFRRLKGHAEMPKLVAALRARDQQLGLTACSSENQAA